MPDVTLWFEVAKYAGMGGAFILGIVSWILWKAYQKELTYSRDRDKETMLVLAKLTDIASDRDSRISDSLDELKNMILNHLRTK